tara:strand:- start:1930 stop:2508 length:579 start_codon:yes stop_codon:yes gene_type:complete
MANEDRFEIICEGLKIYGLLDDVKAREYITELFTGLPDQDYEVLWNERNIIFIITGEENTNQNVQISKNVSEKSESVWIVRISNFDKKSKRTFMSECAHELAHCFYKDTLQQQSQILHAIRQIRTDLKTEEWGYLHWGYLRGHKDTYLYGEYWEQLPGSELISREEAIRIAKLKDNDKIKVAVESMNNRQSN